MAEEEVKKKGANPNVHIADGVDHVARNTGNKTRTTTPEFATQDPDADEDKKNGPGIGLNVTPHAANGPGVK